MKSCMACRTQEASVRDLCSLCARQLPDVTRRLYEKNRATTRRVIDALRIRQTSLKSLGGGRHTR